MDGCHSYSTILREQPLVCNDHVTGHGNTMSNRLMLPSSFPEFTNNGTYCLRSDYVVESSEPGRAGRFLDGNIRFSDQTYMFQFPTTQVPDMFKDPASSSGLTEITCQEAGQNSDTGKTRTFLPQDQEMDLPDLCFSKTLLGSKYLIVAQQILVEIARSGLEDLKEKDQQLPGMTRNTMPSLSLSFPSSPGEDHETLLCCDLKSKKAELLFLMKMIDQRYNHCISQMNRVMDAFHAATEKSGVQMNSRFAFQTISVSYKNMRDKISTDIYSLSEQLISKSTGENAAVESPHLHNGMITRNEQQNWRPQRGLPENSVSILKTWMFQNFLHPYPNDAVKHLLAIKSGLTRSQVSNWFVNARVRIWKPMIEEMYMEYNKKL